MSTKYGDMSMYHVADYDICKVANGFNLNLITFGHAVVNNGWRGTVYSPVYSRLYYIVDGEFFITTNDKERIKLESGNWYLIPTGCSFDYECTNTMEHYYFHLKLTDIGGTDILRKCIKPLHCKADCGTKNLYDLSLFENDFLRVLWLKQTVFSVLSNVICENNADIKSDNYSMCVMNAIQYIKSNLSVRLTISEIAEKTFVSKSTLTKHFKKELSATVNEYIYDLVMSSAEYMLSSTDKSIQTISEKLGFYDQFHFSRRFKEKFEQSPLEYRKRKPV